jgi:hypothetical protein
MSNNIAGPSGLAVISLQKVDSLLVFVNAREAKKVSSDVMTEEVDKNSFESKHWK